MFSSCITLICVYWHHLYFASACVLFISRQHIALHWPGETFQWLHSRDVVLFCTTFACLQSPYRGPTSHAAPGPALVFDATGYNSLYTAKHTIQKCLECAKNCDNGLVNLLHTHTLLMALYPGLPGWAGTRKVNHLKQETVSGSGISWAICKSAPRSRQITMPAPHQSVFLQAGCPSCRPTNSVKALKAELNLLHWSRNRKIRKWMENGNQHSSEEVVQVILNSFKRRDCPVAYSCWCCEWSRRKCVVISAVRH